MGNKKIKTNQNLIDSPELRQWFLLLNQLNNGAFITDKQGTILYTNPSIIKLFGYSEEELLGHSPGILHSGRQDSFFYEAMWQQILTKEYWSGEIWDKSKDGHVFPVIVTISKIYIQSNKENIYIAIYSDLSFLRQKQIKEYNVEQINWITKLPNKNQWMKQFNNYIKKHNKLTNNKSTEKSCAQKEHAIVLLSLDNFERFIENYGYVVGDLTLRNVAEILKKYLSQNECISYYEHGGLFGILFHCPAKTQFHEFFETIRQETATPLNILEFNITITFHCGVSWFPKDATDPILLIDQAREAMLEAQKQNKDIVFYEDLTHKADNT